MNWKQFLKPDWRKAKVVLLLFIISIMSLFLGMLFSVFQVHPLISNFFVWFFYIIFLGPLFAPLSLLHNETLSLLESILFITGIILLLFYWYFLSCLIIWIYDKFRKKKDDYVHIKDVNMVMGQLEKWGKKKKK